LLIRIWGQKMKTKNSILISLGILILLVLSTISGTAFIDKGTSSTPVSPTTVSDKGLLSTTGPLVDPYPQLDAVKKVKFGSSGWVDEIQVPIGSTVRFNISVIYHDIDSMDSCSMLSRINIVDHLGNLEYKANVSCSNKTLIPANYFTFNAGTNTCTWKFGAALILMKNSTLFRSVFYLEFDAKVNSVGSYRNYVEVNGTESCCGRWGYADADAFVNVSLPQNLAINLTKHVKVNNNWVKSTTVNIGDNVQFQILIKNTGNVALTSVYVTDDLPSFLNFNNDANITPATYSIHHIEWNLGALAVGQTKEIVFSAHAIASGEGNNCASVTSHEGATADDCAHIIVNPQGYFTCSKLVWNSQTQQWVDEINAHIGDTVRFKITIIYHGSGTLMNIKVKDILPPCLQYADNANLVQTAVSGNRVFWNLSVTLTNGLNTSIQFDTLVILSNPATNINTANVTASENGVTLYCQDIATVIVLPGQLICQKKVRDPQTQQWVDEINAHIGDTVRFKITLTYYGTGTLMYIKVRDTLPPCLIYADNANPTQNATSQNKIYWNLTLTLTNGQSTSIEFNTLVISTGTNVNLANVTGSENCHLPLYCEDTATVIVQQPSLTCEKKVRDPQTQKWVDEINAHIGDTVRFKITLTYHGTGTLMNIKVRDTLPPCLQYANNANPVQTAVSGNRIFWNLSVILTNGLNTSIQFDTLVIATGTNVNTANVTGSDNCTKPPLSCEDTATVIVQQQPSLVCEKKVRDPQTQKWVDEINAHIGDTVRFKITLTYHGTGTLMNIKVRDTLPPCLQYANNANPVQTAVSGNRIFWNLSVILTNGLNTSIQFDTLVIATGTNVNTANVTGSDNCTKPPLSCEDTATVIVTQPSLVCEKKVRDPQTQKWVDEINANIGDTVRFKITFSYWGKYSFYNIWVNDTLPSCLQYADNANPTETQIIGKTILWHIQTTLSNGSNMSIQFDALVISGGTNTNHVNVTGIECGFRTLFCTATATVIVKTAPLIADAGGPYSGYVNEAIQITGSATGGVPNYVYAWDLNNDGVYNDATGKTISHSWTTQGTKTISLKVTDSVGTNATDTATVTVNIRNQPPNTPRIPAGKATCKINKEYTFTTNTTDPNGDQIWYSFNWGDNTTSGWVGPFASGATASASHTWTKRGTYEIQVKARDSSNAESAYSDSFQIKVKFLASQSLPMNTILQKLIERFPILKRFLPT